MSPQVVTVSELIEYLTDIADGHGDIPVIIYSPASGRGESVGRPIVLTAAPDGESDGFRAYTYPPQENAPQTKVALIN